MSRRSIYKKFDELSCWDLDKGCRKIVDQSRPGYRRLKSVLRKQARKRIERYMIEDCAILNEMDKGSVEQTIAVAE